jgi:hypothetical protein
MRRFRFKVRTLVIAVAVVGLVLGGVQMWRRAVQFEKTARYFALVEASERRTYDWLSMRAEGGESERLLTRSRPSKDDRHRAVAARADMATRAGRIAAHSEALRRKYEWAAAHPWASVSPDPPTPR